MILNQRQRQEITKAFYKIAAAIFDKQGNIHDVKEVGSLTYEVVDNIPRSSFLFDFQNSGSGLRIRVSASRKGMAENEEMLRFLTSPLCVIANEFSTERKRDEVSITYSIPYHSVLDTNRNIDLFQQSLESSVNKVYKNFERLLRYSSESCI